jgi:hypothetical protein
MDGPFVLHGNVPVSKQQGQGGQQGGRARSLRRSLVSKGERGAAEFAGEHLQQRTSSSLGCAFVTRSIEPMRL